VVDLEPRGGGRFALRHGRGVGSAVTLRIGDTERRVVPRRFHVPLWSFAELEAAEVGGASVTARAQVLRPWLSGGTAAALPPGTSGLRGRVTVRDAGTGALVAVRWPRVVARGPGDVPVGWAHGDERGEFVLRVATTGTLPPPAPSTLDLTVVVAARPPTPASAPAPDPWADLPVENVRRSDNPPTSWDLDNGLLRGRSLPPGYRISDPPHPTVTLTVGEVVGVGDVPFTP
jgi:hypothetical protein